jgi:pyruvate dehydrogenase E2 component (dihydrolipoamide acetyltransferase)
MPLHKLLLPDLGIDDQPITLSSWFVKNGTEVNAGDPIVEILCGGATVDLPAIVHGTLVEKLITEDEIVQIGQQLAVIDDGR